MKYFYITLSLIYIIATTGCFKPLHKTASNSSQNLADGSGGGGSIVPTEADNKAYTVLSKHCLSCHNSGGSAPSWGLIKSSTDLINFAYANANRIVPGAPLSSTVILRMKFGPGDQSMPPGQTNIMSSEYDVVYNWIQGLSIKNVGGSTGGTTPVTPVTPDTQGTVIAASSNEKLRLGDRRYVASFLNGIFGASSLATTNTYILGKVAKFGGACDGEDSYSHSYPTVKRCNEPSPGLTSKIINVDSVNIYAPRIPSATLDRDGFRLLACKQILLGSNESLIAAIQTARGSQDLTFLNSMPKLLTPDIEKVYKLFYPGRTPKPPIVEALRQVSEAAQASGLAPVGADGLKYESWRYVFYTLCKSPDWQLQ